MGLIDKLKGLAEAKGLEVGTTGTKTTKEKILAQGNAMIERLQKKDAKLDYAGSNQLWWNGKAVNGKRLVKIYYDGRVVQGFSLWGEDGVKGVENTVKQLLELVNEITDEDWKEEEKRRKDTKK